MVHHPHDEDPKDSVKSSMIRQVYGPKITLQTNQTPIIKRESTHNHEESCK